MARFTIYKDNYVDSTVVSNYFIDEYMKDANDAQLKVYLYLIRMLTASKTTSISDIADKFNHTEKDVLRALKYWEKKTLLSLDFDEEKNLVGVHLCDMPTNNEENNLQTEEIEPNKLISAPIIVPVSPLPKETSDKASFVKPVYSTDQLRYFKNRQDTAQLLFIAESYLGKPLTPGDIKSMIFFVDELHFSEDLIDYLIQYCVDRGKKDFKYIEKVAINWAEEGITSPKQAQKYSTRYDKNVYAIMNALGKNSSPTTKEMEFIIRWTREYSFTNDIIYEACERTVLATDKHRFEYAEGILSNWRREQVHSKADIKKVDDKYHQKRKSAPKPTTSANKFNHFTQNQYDFEQLEQELLSN
ncbi:DnaD domain protein [Lachnospiraceae bacterium OttesenSCG-928-D06]|nr:DnaD domain protein [Lachnospiraceae bacterium OttesenSCG-928-D06]